MTMNRHEPWEELVSASLQGDLTSDERRRLDAHLDGCEHCRATLAAFADQRRIVAGLRHVAPPRDLGARVRAGIEYADIPWWRKPAVVFTAVGGSLAAVAGALLALVVLNGTPEEPQVGQLSPTPTLSAPAPSATASPAPQATPVPVPAATLPAPPPPGETPAPQPSATPNPIAQSSPEPDLYLAMTISSEDQQLDIVDPASEEAVTEPTEPPIGPVIAAELSPDGGWLAVISERGLSGMTELSVSRVADAIQPGGSEATPIPEPDVEIADTIVLGQSAAGAPFLERLAWAPDGSLLAYTIADPDGGGTDVWIFERATSEFWQLTATGDSYAASWVAPDTEDEPAEPALWVSQAEGLVTSHLVTPTSDDGGRAAGIDPAEESILSVEHVFQPLISPNGALAIYWDGVMARSGEEWLFDEGGAPWLAEHHPADLEAGPFGNERLLFSDVTIDREAFISAAIGWALDSDTYVVWGAAWTGVPQSAADQPLYPDPARVYFGHASDPRGLTRLHAIDADDLPENWWVVDVKASPTGRHLVVTVAKPRAGLEPPTAELLLITRNTGQVPDEVLRLGAEDGRWFGPAVFDAYVEIEDAGEGGAPSASGAAP